MTNVLTQGLEQRQQKINVAKDFLSRTQSLFEEFGSEKLRTSHARFAELLDALNADAIRLVVLGEFSRGKSSLVNALLGIELLPTALQATTAINTFIRMLPADRSERFIRIHFQDGRPVQEVPWSDDLALERWGTELDESHADVRQTLDYIEAFMDHPLLEKGLVLVDTPGLETVIKHHEAITRKAIAEAHIALWVQNTTQLGGAATEWAFLTDTLRNNFRKFVTVIGWWDKVLAPDDSRERRVPVDQRIQEKLDVVRQNFRRHLKDDEEFKLLTDRNHLIPVSAHWAMDSDPDKRSQSGIEALSVRIAEMFTSGEALEQIYSKPMQQMSHIQLQLAETLQDELQQLESDKSLQERAREVAQFDLETQLLKQESEAVARDSREEHERAARALVEKIQRELISPLAELKADIENQVDAVYVERQIKKRVTTVTLPEDLHEQFQAISAQVGDVWNQQKQELTKALDGLSVNYSKQMEKHAGRLRSEMGKMDVHVPSLDTQFNLDFSAIEQHHQQAMALEQEIASRHEQIDSIEGDMSKYAANSGQLDLARQALARAERMHDNLGGQPSPKMSSRRERVKKGGMYSDDTYGDVQYMDHSNVEAWKEERDKLTATLADKEQRLEQIVAEEERKTGMRMSLEKAQKKYEREVATFEKKKAQFEQQSQAAEGQLIRDTTARLIKNTAGQLEQRIRHLENHVKEAVHKVFADQMQALQDCVEEQFLEPLNAKLEKRREIHSLLEQGKLDVAQRKARLEQASKEVDDLMTLTQNALKA
ncbi:dynamin family protein [Pseudomonas sp. GM84]|uniref:dynamin family protein n=1 Tax=Pseudomonas sp. GM84 TaxID=1144340 RepID=UPI00026FA4B2|nr:dynamin family protein [Pseudomonas sp. GM84]EJN39811.1 dynamin family protein [Pseudomonas sp. GM84]